MALFTAYFDESGTHDDASAAVVGGYVATVEQWQDLDREWAALLADEQVNILHRTDLETFHGEFEESKGWNRKRQIKVLKKAHAIIKRRTEIGLGASVIRADWDEAMPDVLKRLFGGPYGWGGVGQLVEKQLASGYGVEQLKCVKLLGCLHLRGD